MDHRVRRPILLAVATLVAPLVLTAAAATPTQLFGFSADQAAAQKSIEQRFDAAVKPADLDAWLKNLSSARQRRGATREKRERVR